MENFLFYKTNKSFNNFKSFNNHVRSYAKRNGLNLSQLLKENYDILFRNTNLCIHCGCECEYINYTLGYKNPCYSSECYRTFVESNKEYFYNQTGKFYYDLYDNKQYNCPFTKRYFTLVNEKLSEDYCKNNSLIYEIIDEDYFLNKIDEIDIDSLVQVIETKTIRNLAKSFRRQFVKCPQV